MKNANKDCPCSGNNLLSNPKHMDLPEKLYISPIYSIFMSREMKRESLPGTFGASRTAMWRAILAYWDWKGETKPKSLT